MPARARPTSRPAAPSSATEPFRLSGNSEGPVEIVLNANGTRKLREAGGRLPVTVIVRPSGGAKLERGGFTLVGGGGGGSGPQSSVATPVKPKGAVRVRKGRVALKVRCTGAAPCAGKLALSRPGTFLGGARFTVPAGSARTVAVKLTRKGLKALRKGRGATIGAKATAKSAGGSKSVFLKIKRA